MLEVGIEAGPDDFVAVAEACLRGALSAVRANGFLPGRLDSAWRPAARWFRLTGASMRRALDALLEQIRPDGFLPAGFYGNWSAAALSGCLTGSAQIAIVSYRAHQICGNARYRRATDRLLDFLKRLQDLDLERPDTSGAIPGSFPMLGDFMYLGYPNWATKYLLDALMLQHDIGFASDRSAAPALAT